ncbi:MAG: hypothetical protein U0401_22505 [Anaerolineae bacterium]
MIVAITPLPARPALTAVRNLALDIKTRDYIRAAERGENPWYIMFVDFTQCARPYFG